MRIEFDDYQVERVFHDLGALKKVLGQDKARSLKKRLDQLEASANFYIYLSTRLGRPHALSGNLKGCYGITLSGNLRLVVKPDAKGLDSGSLQECEAVIIKGVVDYHGQQNEWVIP